MVRPKKNEHALSVRKEIRMHPDDAKIIADRAKKTMLSVSEYMRLMSINGAINIQESTTDQALITELNKIGVNLNQIARRFNRTGRIAPPVLLAVLEQHRAVLYRLMVPDH